MRHNRVFLILAVLAVLALVLAGCGETATATPTKAAAATAAAATPTKVAGAATATPAAPAATPTKAAKRGGIVVDAMQVDALNGNLDPHYGGVSGYMTQVCLAYENLFGNDPKTFAVIPKIGEKYQVAADGLSVTITLRKGVKWHNLPPVNGREFTADDVKWNIERQQKANPPMGSTSTWKIVKTVDVIDKYTVKLTFTQPYASIDWLLTDPNYVYYPRELQEAYGDKQSKTVIGTGPFMFKSYEPKVSIEFIRNPDFYIAGYPLLDGYKMVFIADPAARVAAWRGGQIQYTANNNVDVKDQVKSSLPGVQVNDFVGPNHVLWFNATVKPFDNIKVRQAVYLAIDRQEVIKLGISNSGQLVGFYNRGTPQVALTEAELAKLSGYRQPKDADIAEAKKLLAEAGYASGLAINAWNMASVADMTRVAEILKAQLAKVGIDYQIKNVESTVGTAALNARTPEFQAMVTTMTTRSDLDKSNYYGTKSGANVSGWGSAELDVLLEKAQAEFDPAKRIAICKQIETKMHEIANNVPLYQYTMYQLASAELRDWATLSKVPWQFHFEQIKYAWFDK